MAPAPDSAVFLQVERARARRNGLASCSGRFCIILRGRYDAGPIRSIPPM
jgi:hypothetical protein